jgi:hypothetical protein
LEEQNYLHPQDRRLNFYFSVLKMAVSGSYETLARSYCTAHHHTPEERDLCLVMVPTAVGEDCKVTYTFPLESSFATRKKIIYLFLHFSHLV